MHLGPVVHTYMPENRGVTYVVDPPHVSFESDSDNPIFDGTLLVPRNAADKLSSN
jgi:hypothetical protein